MCSRKKTKVRNWLTSVQGDGAVRAAHLLPVGDLSPEDLSDLIHGQRLKGILGVDDHRKTVHGKGDSDGIDAVGLGFGDFRVFHGPGGIGQVGGLVDNGCDTDPGAAAGHRDAGVGIFFHVVFSQPLNDVDFRVRAFDLLKVLRRPFRERPRSPKKPSLKV